MARFNLRESLDHVWSSCHCAILNECTGPCTDHSCLQVELQSSHTPISILLIMCWSLSCCPHGSIDHCAALVRSWLALNQILRSKLQALGWMDPNCSHENGSFTSSHSSQIECQLSILEGFPRIYSASIFHFQSPNAREIDNSPELPVFLRPTG